MAARKAKKLATPARPYWRGNIRLSLVVLPVNVFTGVNRAAEVHFHQIHKKSGQRVRYQKVVPGVGPVEAGDIVKGYEYEKGRYVTLEPDELKALRLETSDAFTIVRFVDRGEIDAIYFDEPFFVAPAEESGVDAFVVVRDAMRETRKVGLGQIVLSGRERIAALQPCGRGMLMETLRYAEDLKKADQFFKVVPQTKADKDQVDLAKQLIKQKEGKFEPEQFQDHYEDAVRELIARKKQGKQPLEQPKTGGAEVIDLMEALRRSVKGKPARGDATPAPAREPRKRAAGGRR